MLRIDIVLENRVHLCKVHFVLRIYIMLKYQVHFYEIHLSLKITIVLEDRFYLYKVPILWSSHLVNNHFHFPLKIYT